MRRSGGERWTCILLAASLFLAGSAVPGSGTDGSPQGVLDGRVFIVERGEMGKQASGKDVYIFRNGTFLPTAYEKWHGFGEGPYASAVNGDTVTFTADTGSDSDGTIHWEGTVLGDRIDVRYTWTGRPGKWYKPASAKVEYWARSVTIWGVEDPGAPGGGGPSTLLDGRTYFVRTGEKSKEADHDDYLIFRDGVFVSSGCVEIDFRTSNYSAVREGDGTRFRAETVSPTHGTMIWDGIVRGDVVDATARWVHERWYWTIDREYWYRGKLYE